MVRPAWSDRRWERAWDHQLDAVERHQIAMDVLHRRLPDDPGQQPVAVELARRWRRSGRNLAFAAVLWIAFWAMIVRGSPPADGPAFGLGVAMTIAGVAAITAIVGVRRRLAAIAQRTDADGPPR